jgi:hypothetical protein
VFSLDSAIRSTFSADKGDFTVLVLRNTRSLGIAIALILGAGVADAANADTPGFYIKADLGAVANSINKDELDSQVAAAFANTGIAYNTSLSSTDAGFDFDAGFRVNNYFAVEAGYVHLGNIEYSITSSGQAADLVARTQGATFAAVGSVPLGTDMSVNARLGGYHLWTSLAAISPGQNATQSSGSGTNLLAGLGVTYALTPRWGLHADWTQYQNVKAISSGFQVDRVNLDLFSIGANYNF